MAGGGTMSFPTLSEEELLNLCCELSGAEVPITLASLRNPTMESTIQIFRFFVSDVLNCDADTATVVPFDAMTRVQFYETHQDQVNVTRFYRVLSSLLKHVHYDLFSIDDLLQPRPKRLRRQLSALANFALHYQRMSEEHADAILERVNEQVEYEERLVSENKTLKSNIHKEIELEEKLKDEIHQLQGAVDERNQEIAALHDEKEQLERASKQSRAEIARLEDQISQIAVEDAKLNEERSTLESQLVGSPEKVRQTLTRAQEELQATEEQRRAATERQQHLRKARQQSEQLTTALERLQQPHLETIKDLAERQREVNGTIKAVTDEMDTCRSETAEMRSSTRQRANRCEMIEESREGQMQKNKRYLKDKEEELAERERVREAARARLAADQQEAARLAERRQQLQQRAQQDAEQHRLRADALQRQHRQLVDAVEWVRTESDRLQSELLAGINAGFA